tara:strand:- start:171 stop:422 length:252 start_codon:yes stop_codon:yes gene_type:complete
MGMTGVGVTRVLGAGESTIISILKMAKNNKNRAVDEPGKGEDAYLDYHIGGLDGQQSLGGRTVGFDDFMRRCPFCMYFLGQPL